VLVQSNHGQIPGSDDTIFLHEVVPRKLVYFNGVYSISSGEVQNARLAAIYYRFQRVLASKNTRFEALFGGVSSS
jgi:hypothetical protein